MRLAREGVCLTLIRRKFIGRSEDGGASSVAIVIPLFLLFRLAPALFNFPQLGYFLPNAQKCPFPPKLQESNIFFSLHSMVVGIIPVGESLSLPSNGLLEGEYLDAIGAGRSIPPVRVPSDKLP
jgi:hypothetical protein